MQILLIPSPNPPGKDMIVYFRLVVDELKDLWERGVQTHDAVDNHVFNMSATLMWSINDFPTRNSLFG